ncbi:[lysine-biosynthesis-protein LysW]--L-2-aminoadipate ligase [Thermocatellispora tengchongensis]|uniref:[lysine-biosynthesis-protein LysW]--L-2-aminoadipate ligase n=1 Tax=Thermocatellispora tengchongensis TaxID=1073253 RepID=A0A840P456_9ACTN|nr:RimK family alpha-L-glutamate ligase [Thermocatellispora tengchongensis]MBB5136084.1 [lysine-biosynthesis-protein LysW]--L-2-aminoadipate ligase [Thermocatellispora tengchongensis]
MSEPRADVLVSVTITRLEERMLLQALRAAGLTARAVKPRHTTAFLNDGALAPRLVILRNLSHRELRGMSDRFEHAGVPTLNTPHAVRLCLSKDLQAFAFARAGVPHPETRIAFSADQVREQVEALGGDAVIKPVSGSWGRGVVRVTTPAELAAWSGGWEAVDPGERSFPVIVQEHVPKPGFNERVIVVGDRPVVAYRQVSQDLRTNTHLGGGIEPIPLSHRSAELCSRVVALFGPGFYGIDLVESAETGRLYVLEVNTNPEFAKSVPVHGVDIPALLARFVRSAIEEERAGRLTERKDMAA